MLYSLTTKYCVMALANLARREPDQGIQVKEIAEDTGIPAAFLGRLIPPLVKAGFVTSKRGRNGGLRLACPADAISLADVVLITEGKIFFEDCLLTLDSCDGTKGCPQHEVWRQHEGRHHGIPQFNDDPGRRLREAQRLEAEGKAGIASRKESAGTRAGSSIREVGMRRHGRAEMRKLVLFRFLALGVGVALMGCGFSYGGGRAVRS